MRQISVDPITHLLQGPTGRKAAQQQQQQQQPSAKALRAAAVPLGQARHLPDLLPSDHASHVYGIPSIRHDIHRPARQSLADFQNYGDEFGCKVLMNHHDTRKLYLEAELKQRGL